MLTTLIFITSIALGGFIIFDLVENAKAKKTERQAEEARITLEKRKKAEEKRLQMVDAYKAEFDNLVSSYGSCTTDVLLSSSEATVFNHLFIFEESSMIVLRGEHIPFSKVLGFALNDEAETIVHNEIQYKTTTKTSTGSMLGRAAVGGAILGGVGVLAGAATSKKESTTLPTRGHLTSTTKHNYTLFVNLDDLSSPTREINLGSDIRQVQNIANIFNIIVQRNKI